MVDYMVLNLEGLEVTAEYYFDEGEPIIEYLYVNEVDIYDCLKQQVVIELAKQLRDTLKEQDIEAEIADYENYN